MEAAWTEYITAWNGATANHTKNITYSDTEGNTYYAYVNKYGIAKPYASVADYTATKESCGNGPTISLLDRSWSTIGYPKGVTVTPGTTCGYENSYVTASFPPSTLSGMTHIGKIGYVDVDNVYHPMTPVFSSGYKQSVSSRIMGSSMVSCLGSTIRFGDPIQIKYDTSYIKTNASNNLETTSELDTATTFYIKPPGGVVNTSYVTYGDPFVLSDTKLTTSTSKYVNINTSIDVPTLRIVDGTSSSFKFLDSAGSLSATGDVKIGNSLVLCKVADTSQYVYASRSSILTPYSFQIRTDTKDANFSVLSPAQGSATSCNVDLLQTECRNTTGCMGIIHSTADNTWQMMNLDTVYSEGAVGSVYDTYLRNMDFDLSNNLNCPDKVPQTRFELPTSQLNFTQGSAFSAGYNCPAIPPLSVPAYDNYMSSLKTQWTSLSIPPTSDISLNIQKVNTAAGSVVSTRHGYTTTFGSIATKFNISNNSDATLSQRIQDSVVLDEHSRALAILWGILSVSVISIIIFRPK